MVRKTKFLILLLILMMAQAKAHALNIYEQADKAIQLGKEERYKEAAKEMQDTLEKLG